jgi:hypothetical protein
MISAWIWEGNLRPFLEMVALLVKCPFDADNWTAIQYGVRDTDNDADKRYTYPLLGEPELLVEVAAEPGASTIMVYLSSEAILTAELRAQITTLINVCQNYSVVVRY